MLSFTGRAQVARPSSMHSSLGGSTLDLLMASATDPRRGARHQFFLDEAMAKGFSPTLALLEANHKTSPYMGLKYRGTPLPVDAERYLEDTVLQTALRKRNAVNDLIGRGLVRPLPDIGVFTDVWKRASNQTGATLDMNLSGGPQYDRQDFDTDGVPIPIIQKRFEFEAREMMAAARAGTPLDRMHAVRAAEMVAEAEENLLINGSTLLFNGFNLYGYRTHPSRITSVSGADWGTPSNVFVVVNNVMDALRQANMEGPTVFYVAPTQYAQALADHKAESDKTALARALEIPGVESIKSNQWVPAGELVAVVMSPSVVDLAIAQNITTVPWESEGGARQHWRVFSSMAPRIFVDRDSQCGVVHVTGI